MANPNIVSVATLRANNSLVRLTSIANTSVVNNADGSNTVYKLNSIVATNVEGTTPAYVSIIVYDQDDLAGNGYPIIALAPVPARSSLIIMDKSTGIYLKENQSIGAASNSSNSLVVIASWEEIS